MSEDNPTQFLTLNCPNPDCPQVDFKVTVETRKGDIEKLVDQIYRCPYCGKKAAYKIPEIYTDKTVLFRGIKGEAL